MGNVTFKIIVRDDGTAEIRVPEGASQQRDAGRIASFTEKLAKFLGRIKERHVGKPLDNHHHTHEDGSVHTNH